MVNSGVADQTIARVAAREAADDPALAEQVRQCQSGAHLRDKARMELAPKAPSRTMNATPAPDADAASADLKTAVGQCRCSAGQIAAPLSRTMRSAGRSGPGRACPTCSRSLRPREAFARLRDRRPTASFALLVNAQRPDGRAADRDGADDLAADIADAAQRLRAQARQAAGVQSEESSYALYQQLLGPVEPALAASIIWSWSPGGDLASLPFSLLVTAEPRRQL